MDTVIKRSLTKPKKGDEEMRDAESAFSQLAGKLSHQKGVDNPDALAAYIGRKSLGNKAYNKRISKGLKHKEDVGFSGLASVARGISGKRKIESNLQDRRTEFIEGDDS